MVDTVTGKDGGIKVIKARASMITVALSFPSLAMQRAQTFTNSLCRSMENIMRKAMMERADG